MFENKKYSDFSTLIFSSLISHFFKDHGVIKHVYCSNSDCFIFWVEMIEVAREKWFDYARERKKETQDSFESKIRQRKFHVTERRNEIREKITREISKGQRPTLFNRVSLPVDLLPVDFHFESICHLIFHDFSNKSTRQNSITVKTSRYVEILCNSMQNRFFIFDIYFHFQ